MTRGASHGRIGEHPSTSCWPWELVGFNKGIAVGESVNKVLAMGELVAFDGQTTGINEHTSAHRAHTPVSQHWHTLGEEGKRQRRALGHNVDSRGGIIEGARDQSKHSPQRTHAQKKHALVLARAI